MNNQHRLLGLINLLEADQELGPLTMHRPVASVPFGGRYRIIDFVLSNMSGAGIQTVGIYTDDRERSIMDHIRAGQPWDMDRMSGGIFYFSHHALPERHREERGDLLNYYNNMDILEKSNCDYVAISGSNMVLNINLMEVLAQHLQASADVTVVYTNKMSNDPDYQGAYVLHTDEEDQVRGIGIHESPKRYMKDISRIKVSCEIYLMKTTFFQSLLENAVYDGNHRYLREMLHDPKGDFRMQGYEFTGYTAYISSIQNYYRANMNLLNERHLMDLFYGSNLINTKIRNESPSHYGQTARVQNSLIANGCHIEGEVINSILFRRVTVEAGARIENCIIMQNGVIAQGAKLKYVITDKNVNVGKGEVFVGSEKTPHVIQKGARV
ncbi:Glucose-1-phosphate adenylyltransferase [Clostridiaceae bacterium JG1575]|nr:Glucose-1-phosphate adenylyltransferase [Clostridiaceae bacterium JG1575]